MTGRDIRTSPDGGPPGSILPPPGEAGLSMLEERERDQIADALDLTRAAKCMLLVGGQITTLAVVAARLGQEEIRFRRDRDEQDSAPYAIARSSGRLFHGCRQVRILLPELALRADELIRACCLAVEGVGAESYNCMRRALLWTICGISRRIHELAEAVCETCAVLSPLTEVKRHVVTGLVTAARSLGRIAGQMEKATGLECIGLANPS